MNARIEPTLDVDIPLEFDGIEDVLQLTRSAARENLRLHMSALLHAKDDADKVAAGIELGKAFEASRAADRAFHSFMSSEAAFHATAGRDLLGQEVPSPAGGTIGAPGYEASALHMADAATRVNAVAEYAPSSAFFQAALTAVKKTDAAVAKVETAASAKVAGFVKGLKAFGKRMADFGTQIAAVPEKSRDLAAKTSVSASTATKEVLGRLMSRVRAAATSVSKTVSSNLNVAVSGVKDAHYSAKQSAWEMLDDAAKFADRQKDRVKAAASTVDTHARVVMAPVGLAGGFLATVGRHVAESYRAEVEKVETKKALRRATPR